MDLYELNISYIGPYYWGFFGGNSKFNSDFAATFFRDIIATTFATLRLFIKRINGDGVVQAFF